MYKEKKTEKSSNVAQWSWKFIPWCYDFVDILFYARIESWWYETSIKFLWELKKAKGLIFSHKII